MTPREEIGGRARVARPGPGVFNVATVLAVLLLSVLGALAAVLLGGWADELRGDDMSGEHVLSQSATGYGALMALLQDTGVETSVLRSGRTAGTGKTTGAAGAGAVRVYTLSRPVRASQLEEIAKTRWQLQRGGGPVLFVLPKWRTAEAEDRTEAKKGWVRRTVDEPDLHTRSALADGLELYGPDLRIARAGGLESYTLDPDMNADIDTVLSRSRRTVKVEALQYLAPGWTDIADHRSAVVSGETVDPGSEDILDQLYGGRDKPGGAADDEDGAEEDGKKGDSADPASSVTNSSRLLVGPDLALDGRVVFFSVHDKDGDMIYHVLTDPDLLNTQGLATLSRARLGLGIIDHMRTVGNGPPAAVGFDLTLHGFARSSNPIKTMTRPPLLGATLCALMAAVLAGWMAFGRFGDPVRAARTAHAGTGKRALIDNGARLIRLARRTLGLADDYAALSQRRVLRSLRLSGGRDARVAAALEGLGTSVGADIPAQLSAIGAAPDTGELVKAARRFHDTTDAIADIPRTNIPKRDIPKRDIPAQPFKGPT